MSVPKDEIVWETYMSADGSPQFVVTSKKARDYYFAYEVNGTDYKKLGKAKTPVERIHRRYIRQHTRNDPGTGGV